MFGIRFTDLVLVRGRFYCYFRCFVKFRRVEIPLERFSSFVLNELLNWLMEELGFCC